MAARQASRLASSSADGRVVALGGVGWVGWARAAKDDTSPDSRLTASIMLRSLAMRPHAELEHFMGDPLMNELGGGRVHATASF
jgi:hypothetical protein